MAGNLTPIFGGVLSSGLLPDGLMSGSRNKSDYDMQRTAAGKRHTVVTSEHYLLTNAH